MNNHDQTNQELLEELARLRRRVAEQEAQLAGCRQAEADQRQINDGLPVLVATAGLDGWYKEVNAAFERILGWSEQESLSRPFMEFIHPDDRVAAVETFGRLKSGEVVTRFADRNLCKDGSYRWISWDVIPLPERAIVFGIGQDVTEKKRAETKLRQAHAELERRVKERTEELRNSVAELQAIYDGMIDGFNIFDMDTLKTIRANPALCQMMGYTEEELKRLPVEKAHPEEDLPWILERAEAHAAGRVSRSEDIPVMRRDGSVFYTDVSSNPINYMGRRCVISFFHDITERREAENELRRSEARYKALVESSPDPIVMFDLEGRITFASPQTAEGHQADEAVGLTGRSVMDLVAESDRELVKSNMQRLLESGIRRNDEYRGLHPDGTPFVVDVSASVINGASGDPEAVVAVYRDVTEQKKAQEALQKEQDSLRRMLRASDRDRELIGYDVHDGIAQRLVGALMQFEAVLQVDHGLAGDARARFDMGLAELRQASAEARSLINRTRTPVLEEFGVAAAISEFIDQFNKVPEGPEIAYSCDAQFERLEPVLESTIFRVVQEAVTNAYIHSKSEIVRVTLDQQGDNVTIDVQDSGIGFDPASVQDDRFGLYGIRERTRLLGKDLRIESTPGQGTRIRATFPLVFGDK